MYATGGQLVSCRDTARLSQLIVNKGLWVGEDGQTIRLISEDYIAEMVTPQFPVRGFTYGLLTWLNARRDPKVSPPCCAPRWGPAATCSGRKIDLSILGDGIANLAPSDVAMAMGWLGQYMYIVPSRNLTIASLGASWGSSQQCPLGNAKATDPVYNDGYDDAFSASVLWGAIDNATRPATRTTSTNMSISVVHLLTHPIPTSNGPMGPSNQLAPVRSIPPRRRQRARGTDGHQSLARPLARSLATGGGSCSCKCPPGRGFGRCYDVPAGTATCASVVTKAADDCPSVGVPRQCAWPPVPSDWDCATADNSMRGDVGSITVWGGHLKCSLQSNCSLIDASIGLATATCSCRPAEYGDYACDFSPQPCGYSPYFPPGS